MKVGENFYQNLKRKFVLVNTILLLMWCAFDYRVSDVWIVSRSAIDNCFNIADIALRIKQCSFQRDSIILYCHNCLVLKRYCNVSVMGLDVSWFQFTTMSLNTPALSSCTHLIATNMGLTTCSLSRCFTKHECCVLLLSGSWLNSLILRTFISS
jgi:hypothetical protein